VLIMGGGPAGLATAIELAARDLAALVVERSDYNDVRIGEHVQPPAVLQLRALSSRLKLPLGLHFACGGVEAYWGSSEPNYTDYCFHPAQHGLSLLRPQFDADLAAACDLSGATVLRGATLKCAQKQETGWDVDIVVRGRTQGFSVSLIVDATGRSVAFSRRQGAKVYAHDRQMAIVTFEDDANNGASTRSLIETAEIGWWYRSPIGPARSICMLITDSDLVPRGGPPQPIRMVARPAEPYHRVGVSVSRLGVRPVVRPLSQVAMRQATVLKGLAGGRRCSDGL
jgi:flavin-dependent dehydrogenase